MSNLLPLFFLWTFFGIIVIAATWLRWRRSKPNPAQAFLTAFIIALLFTPFIPHLSVQWSTPWPPALIWLGLAFISGDTMPFELFTITALTLVIWIVGLGISRTRTSGNNDSANPS